MCKQGVSKLLVYKKKPRPKDFPMVRTLHALIKEVEKVIRFVNTGHCSSLAGLGQED